MKPINIETKITINGFGKMKSSSSNKGYAWNKFAMASVVTSIGVSFIANVLNIVNSAQRKSPSSHEYVEKNKIYGSKDILNSKFF